MYGTVARMKIKPGQIEALEEWAKDSRLEDTPGAIAGYAFRMDDNPNEIYMAVVFEDKESYVANAESPETNEQYLKMRESLEAEPEWHDGEIVWCAPSS